jgi:protein-L-isoaspartate(D-aspartate) O-methyltransferase
MGGRGETARNVTGGPAGPTWSAGRSTRPARPATLDRLPTGRRPSGKRLGGRLCLHAYPRRVRRSRIDPPARRRTGGVLGIAEQRRVDVDALYAALARPGVDVACGVRVTLSELRGLSLWLALHEPGLAGLSATGAAADHGLVPALYAYPRQIGTATVALVGTDPLAALVRRDEQQPFELGARPLGHGGPGLAQRLVGHIHEWNTHGRPTTAGLHVSAYLRETDHAAIAGANSIIEKRYTRLALNWAS